MNRRLTNSIRFVMDELIPPFIRDSKIFMYPFFYLAFRGKNIKEVMNFKSNVYGFSVKEYAEFYKSIDTISRNRKTDLNQGCIDAILNSIDADKEELIIDIGCGNGFILNEIASSKKNKSLFGFDLKRPEGDFKFEFTSGNIEQLPYEDNSFDVVLCNHTIEHLLDEEKCVSELIRITRKRLIIVTPCQRYFYYTLDEHVNFYPFKEKLTSKIPLDEFSCTKIQGDWLYDGVKINS
ncbi:MAG TPA: class I SAM-dependent methyltransferase [Crocinitomicaceae bacterium]|nr:class I SAM-dependent methyltransferase [Crocinitomicaceae bacterium]